VVVYARPERGDERDPEARGDSGGGCRRLQRARRDRTLARLRGLRSDLIDPAIAAHHGRIVKRTGDGSIIEFRSVVDPVRCAIEAQPGLIERNFGIRPERRIEFRVGIHPGVIVEESDGDLIGGGGNIAARLEGVAKPGAICLSEDAHRQVKSRLDIKVSDLGSTQLKNIAERSMSIRSRSASRPRRSRRFRLRQPIGQSRQHLSGFWASPRSPPPLPPSSFLRLPAVGFSLPVDRLTSQGLRP
jgi:class 3 adenylate cyclase